MRPAAMLARGTRCMAASTSSRSRCVAAPSLHGSSTCHSPRASGAVPAGTRSRFNVNVMCVLITFVPPVLDSSHTQNTWLRGRHAGDRCDSVGAWSCVTRRRKDMHGNIQEPTKEQPTPQAQGDCNTQCSAEWSIALHYSSGVLVDPFYSAVRYQTTIKPHRSSAHTASSKLAWVLCAPAGQCMLPTGCSIRRALHRNASCHRCFCRGSGGVSAIVQPCASARCSTRRRIVPARTVPAAAV